LFKEGAAGRGRKNLGGREGTTLLLRMPEQEPKTIRTKRKQLIRKKIQCPRAGVEGGKNARQKTEGDRDNTVTANHGLKTKNLGDTQEKTTRKNNDSPGARQSDRHTLSGIGLCSQTGRLEGLRRIGERRKEVNSGGRSRGRGPVRWAYGGAGGLRKPLATRVV